MKYLIMIFIFSVFILTRRSKVLLALLCIGGLHYSIASAIEVGGHLIEDTTWSPENNPYEVTEILYVDEGTTLTILPGTEVKISGALLTCWWDEMLNFWLDEDDSIAKFIWVHGNIIAIGTEENKITFTRLQDDIDYCWGTIFIDGIADTAIFENCIFEYSNYIGLVTGYTSRGAVCFRDFSNNNVSSSGIFRNNIFINNSIGIYCSEPIDNLEIINNTFTYDQNISPYIYEESMIGHLMLSTPLGPNNVVLVCNNTFQGPQHVRTSGVLFAFNELSSPYSYLKIGHPSQISFKNYIFKNQFINCNTGITVNTTLDSIYVKSNNFLGGNDAIDIDTAFLEIRDNYFNGNKIDIFFSGPDVIFTSNFVKNSKLFCGIINTISNNIFINNVDALSGIGVETFTNNVFLNNDHIFSTASDQHIIENNILLNNDEVYNNIYGSPIFRNCIIDFPLDPPLIDGGDNIIVDSLQAQEIFLDIENGDFHLATNSIAIDAGFDTLGYYYPFDIDNNVRVWDGNGDGDAIIDIGSYEYGAPQLGKISGYITETISGESVDYVFLKANNEPGEFTFADSSGYFEIQLPEGTYDLYAERVFYEDNIIYTVTVENEQDTELNFNMTYNDPLVSINENELNINNSNLKTSNYPNPFNPTTTISFNTVTECNVLVEVFNIKGQKIKTLINKKMNKGQHSVIWNGINKNNQVVSSGIYLYKIRAGKQESVKRMMLLK